MGVADDGDHRRAGIQRLDEAGDEVRRAGSERRVDQADAAGDLGIGVGGEDAGALVIDEVVLEAEAAGGVIEGQELEAAHAEHRAAVEGEDHPRQGFAARHLVVAHHASPPAAAAAFQTGW